jgi:hypothetical protein
MNKSDAPEKRESFRVGMRWPKGQRISILRNFVALRNHCEERQHRKIVGNKACDELKRNKRLRSQSQLLREAKQRSNFLSLTKAREVFNILNKNSSPQIQCREIASGMQQRFTEFIFALRLTAPRNDEGKCRRRLLQTSRTQQRIEIIL